MRTVRLLVAALLSLACFGSAAEARRKPDCASIPGLGPLLEASSTLLLGEVHGVVESPRFAGDVVCMALATGRHVTLALELPVEESALVESFVTRERASAHARARTALLAGAFWSKSYQDGRASAARLALLERVAGWRDARLPVRVVSFDPGIPAGAEPGPAAGAVREQGMAEALARAIGVAPKDLVVVLAGNVHSRVSPGVAWDPTFEPLGLRLARLLPQRKATALDVGYHAGSAWMCTTAEASSCGERGLIGVSTAHTLASGAGAGEAPSVGSPQASPPVTVRLFGSIADGHDGVYDVGALTPSTPARRPAGAQ